MMKRHEKYRYMAYEGMMFLGMMGFGMGMMAIKPWAMVICFVIGLVGYGQMVSMVLKYQLRPFWHGWWSGR